MISPFEWMMAYRYLRARKAEGFVSVIAAFSFLGIMLGVATLIIVMSVMNGFRAELVDRILGLNGHINVFQTGAGHLDDYQKFMNAIETIKDVQSVAPIVESQILLTAKGNATGAMLRGLTPKYFLKKPILATSIQEGNIASFQGNTVAIGVKMAEKLSLNIGDTITILSPKGRAGPFGTIPRSMQLTVAIIFDVGMFEYNSSFIFLPLDTAQNFMQLAPTQVSMLEIITKNVGTVDTVKPAIKSKTGDALNIYDWRDSNSSFLNALQVERNVMFLILTLIILVAAFNIISSMIMLVKDKSRDIAIMRTMGAEKSSVMKIFMITGASVGIAGTAMGSLLGILFAVNIESIRQALQTLSGTELFSAEIYFFSKLPALVDWHEVITIVIMAIIVSILATVYPAFRASKLDPVEALRYE
jgi:lipoprotein-releasing system permease protein